jgi:predicted acyl esterase
LNSKKTKSFVIILFFMLLTSLFLAGCILPTGYMVEMRDGVHLATDVYLPKGQNNPHGSILIRTPYNKDPMGIIGMNWAGQGWPTIIQDIRGRFSSEGIDTVFRNAHTDGPDTLEWISNQDWSNGKIATWGGSALGIHQYFMAGDNPPNLACQFIQVATPNLYKHVAYQGGEFREAMVERWLTKQGSLHALPELYANENYTFDFWTNVSLEDNWSDVNVPAIHIGGWYDCMQQGILDGFMGYQYLGGSGAQGNSKLIMGPWTHGGHTGELIYPENSKDTFSGAMFWDMVEQFTMNGPNDYDSWPTVSYYVLGDVDDINAPGKEWRYADDWPLPYNETEWYLHENDVLSTEMPSGYDSITYTYNPTTPVPTVGGQNLNIAAGAYDQTSVEGRDDVLLFSSPVLDEPYEATGPIKARLYVSSDSIDTDFTAKLCDVYPDGRSIIITDSILRMRNRNGFDHWEFMNPGEIYEIEVDMWSTSYVWNKGHQIRLAVSSSNYPRFKANPNTGEPMGANITYNIAENTLYFNSTYPSCIILPEIAQPIPGSNPNTPEKINGLKIGKAGGEYCYSILVDDPDGDNIYALFDWGDGSYSGWIGPYKSGEKIKASHVWKEKGTYNIKVKIRDNTGAKSDWSEPIEVRIPIEKKLSNIQFKQSMKNKIEQYQELKHVFRDMILINYFDLELADIIYWAPHELI